ALPVTLKFDDLRKIPGELWKKDQFSYQLDTSINIKLPVIGLYTIPFSKKDTLPVPKLPSIQIKNLNVTDLSLTTAKIVAEVEIDNPNNFNLGLSNFNYRLNINQETWGEGTSSKPGSIPKKGKGTIQIPLQLDLVNMGKTAYKLLSSKDNLDYQMVGGVTLDTGIDLLRQYEMPLNIKGTTSF
ncbi:MAG: LEA type 2 family protein, partial [Gammaproteobacteria bacterium]|nr:LEA type 2 family protein [Gammaproteobacteria bacterium]